MKGKNSIVMFGSIKQESAGMGIQIPNITMLKCAALNYLAKLKKSP